MDGIISMLLKGVGAGAWAVGLAVTLALALPLFALVFGMIGCVMNGFGGKDDEEGGAGDGRKEGP